MGVLAEGNRRISTNAQSIVRQPTIKVPDSLRRYPTPPAKEIRPSDLPNDATSFDLLIALDISVGKRAVGFNGAQQPLRPFSGRSEKRFWRVSRHLTPPFSTRLYSVQANAAEVEKIQKNKVFAAFSGECTRTGVL